MRFQILCRRDGEEDFRPLFDADTVEDARQIAIRTAMWPGCTVCVQDTVLDERVRDFDDEKYR